MSLQITRIIEGGIDLLSGQELPQSIVVSNGAREVIVPVSQEVLKEVVVLYAEAESAPENRQERSGFFTPEEEYQPEISNTPTTRKKPRLVPAPETPQKEIRDEAVSSDTLDEKFEPGEEYNDAATGVGSL